MRTGAGRSWTMQEIADAAGVSRTTVSHALSGRRPVNPETVERIQRVISGAGYVPDARAQRLAGRSGVIGLVVPDIGAAYFGSLATGVEQVVHERGSVLVIGSTARYDTDRELRYFDLVRNRMLDGLIYNGARLGVPLDGLVEAARTAPVVLADEPLDVLPDAPLVLSDNRGGGRAIARHLADLGHRGAVVLLGAGNLHSQAERLAGVREVFPDALAVTCEFGVAAGHAVARSLRANGIFPTAIICGSDAIAIGVMQWMVDEGLVPGVDISVAGFDDDPSAVVVRPKLTTVRADIVGTGRAAASLLLDWLKSSEDEPRSITLPMEIVVRESTGPVRDAALVD